MKLVTPEYAKDFRCTADKCSDNCCIGWEIDIDPEAFKKYKKISHTLSCSIECVTEGEPPHFILTESGRCPYLKENNLCEIITNFGDGYLCQICRDHPRYYNVFADGEEWGVGLACEEAAILILTAELPIRFVSEVTKADSRDEYDGRDDLALLDALALRAREEIYALVFSDEAPSRIAVSLAEYADTVSDVAFDLSTGLRNELPDEIEIIPKSADDTTRLSQILTCFSDTLPTLEAMTDDLAHVCNCTKRIIVGSTESDVGENTEIDQSKARVRLSGNFLEFLDVAASGYFKRLLFYFVHRYFRSGIYDGNLGERLAFSVASSLAITTAAYCSDATSLGEYVRYAKGYSKNLEYSTENVDALLDALAER